MKSGTILLLLLLFCLVSIDAKSAGISPAKYEDDFSSFLEKEYTFSYYFSGGPNVEYYVTGDMEDYAKITNVKRALDRTVVTVRLELPATLEKAGINTLYVGGREFNQGPDEGLGINFNVLGRILIRVPYPGKYAELDLKTSNVNEGDDVPYELTVYSRGDDSLILVPRLEISNDEGVKDIISLQTRTVGPRNVTVYTGNIRGSTFTAGDYKLTAFVDYGGEKVINASANVRVGELRIAITNYTKALEGEKVGRYLVYLESFWNQDIPNMYTTLEFPDHPTMNTQSSQVTAHAWKGDIITINFVDTSGVEETEVFGTITVHYAGQTTTQDISLTIIHPTNWTNVLIITGAIIGLLIILFLILYIWFVLKQTSKQQHDEQSYKKKRT